MTTPSASRPSSFFPPPRSCWVDAPLPPATRPTSPQASASSRRPTSTASIAAAIGGEQRHVTSIIDSAAQDPHSYEASAQDQLAISKADVIVENGGGYDPFIDTLIDAAAPTPSPCSPPSTCPASSRDDAATDEPRARARRRGRRPRPRRGLQRARLVRPGHRRRPRRRAGAPLRANSTRTTPTPTTRTTTRSPPTSAR